MPLRQEGLARWLGGHVRQLHVTRAELLLLAGSVNEAIEAVEDWEFSTRLGVNKANARALRTELGDLIARLPHG